jgi:hypothetical protein
LYACDFSQTIENEVAFKSFSIARSEKKEKNPTFGFQWVAKHIEGLLKTYNSYLVYSHIWLNLPKEDCQFFHIFLWMVGHCGSKIALRKTLCVS